MPMSMAKRRERILQAKKHLKEQAEIFSSDQVSSSAPNTDTKPGTLWETDQSVFVANTEQWNLLKRNAVAEIRKPWPEEAPHFFGPTGFLFTKQYDDIPPIEKRHHLEILLDCLPDLGAILLAQNILQASEFQGVGSMVYKSLSQCLLAPMGIARSRAAVSGTGRPAFPRSVSRSSPASVSSEFETPISTYPILMGGESFICPKLSRRDGNFRENLQLREKFCCAYTGRTTSALKKRMNHLSDKETTNSLEATRIIPWSFFNCDEQTRKDRWNLLISYFPDIGQHIEPSQLYKEQNGLLLSGMIQPDFEKWLCSLEAIPSEIHQYRAVAFEDMIDDAKIIIPASWYSGNRIMFHPSDNPQQQPPHPALLDCHFRLARFFERAGSQSALELYKASLGEDFFRITNRILGSQHRQDSSDERVVDDTQTQSQVDAELSNSLGGSSTSLPWYQIQHSDLEIYVSGLPDMASQQDLSDDSSSLEEH